MTPPRVLYKSIDYAKPENQPASATEIHRLETSHIPKNMVSAEK
jgi:hypothetical protein